MKKKKKKKTILSQLKELEKPQNYTGAMVAFINNIWHLELDRHQRI